MVPFKQNITFISPPLTRMIQFVSVECFFFLSYFRSIAKLIMLFKAKREWPTCPLFLLIIVSIVQCFQIIITIAYYYYSTVSSFIVIAVDCELLKIWILESSLSGQWTCVFSSNNISPYKVGFFSLSLSLHNAFDFTRSFDRFCIFERSKFVYNWSVSESNTIFEWWWSGWTIISNKLHRKWWHCNCKKTYFENFMKRNDKIRRANGAVTHQLFCFRLKS